MGPAPPLSNTPTLKELHDSWKHGFSEDFCIKLVEKAAVSTLCDIVEVWHFWTPFQALKLVNSAATYLGWCEIPSKDDVDKIREALWQFARSLTPKAATNMSESIETMMILPPTYNTDQEANAPQPPTSLKTEEYLSLGQYGRPWIQPLCCLPALNTFVLEASNIANYIRVFRKGKTVPPPLQNDVIKASDYVHRFLKSSVFPRQDLYGVSELLGKLRYGEDASTLAAFKLYCEKTDIFELYKQKSIGWYVVWVMNRWLTKFDVGTGVTFLTYFTAAMEGIEVGLKVQASEKPWDPTRNSYRRGPSDFFKMA